MLENIDEKTIKFALVILVVIIIFSIPFAVISNQTPKDKMVSEIEPALERVNKTQTTEEEDSVTEEEISSNEDAEEEEEQSKEEESQEAESESDVQPLEPLENLPDEANEANQNSVTIEKPTIDSLISKANNYRADKNYVKAIETYKAAAEQADDMTQKAQCYEQVASVYAIVKRYGSAMAYAQKAYNMSPSTSRELLLARLYYKTGDVDKATKRVNNILQRDFSVDR